MAAAPLDSSSTTPPGAAAAESDQTRFHGDPMEDTDPQSTRKRPRLDSGSRVCESWSTDDMSGRTAPTAPVTAADGAADHEASTAASRPASRVTINVKSPTTGSAELGLGPGDDPATSSSSSTTLPDQSSSGGGGAPPPAQQSADTDTAGQASNNAISLSSSPVQSPEIEVADVEDVDQDTNTSNWKPLGEAMRDRVTPEVVQLQDQLSLTDTFPKLHEHLGLRENLDEVCAIIEKGKGRKEAGHAVPKLRRSTGNPHDVTVFLAVKNWLDDAVNNLDQLNYDTYTDDRDFWEELPVMVEFLLRRV